MNIAKINSIDSAIQFRNTRSIYLNPKPDILNFGMKISPHHQLDTNELEYGATKSYFKKKLKDENLLYKMYTGKDVSIPQEILEDEALMAELYQDVDFMKASNSALLRATQDRLQDETLSDEYYNELLTLSNLFTLQKELFDNPYNSFEIGLDKKSQNKSTKKNNGMSWVMQEPQLAFGTIFNYGFFNKPKTRRQKAEAIVNRQATKAAAKSAVCLQISTTLEVALLTENTMKMCRRICETYQMPGAAITSLITQVSGAMAGKAAASWATKWFPGIGNAANATITYSLHQAQGRAIIAWCEANYNNPNITDWDMAAKGINLFRGFNAIGGNSVDNYIKGFGSDEGLSDFINGCK